MIEHKPDERPVSLRLVDRNDPVLWTPAVSVTDFETQVLPHIEDMRTLMRVGPIKAAGLAAPQVGIPLRFFLTKFQFVLVVINPIIVESSTTRTAKREGCMSWNGGRTEVFVSRPDWIVARYLDRDGKEFTRRFVGIEGRVFQHEYDHLNGICIFSK